MYLYNGEIISYGISVSPTLDLTIRPLKEAIDIVKDSKYRTTLHSDQGWQYKHKTWVKTLKENMGDSSNQFLNINSKPATIR
jgi:putative transposase